MGSAGEVEDAETAVSQVYGRIGVGAFRIWTTMLQGSGHGGECRLRLFRGVAMGSESCDAAHRSSCSGTTLEVSSEDRSRFKFKFKFKLRRA